jgi:lysophospholipase L1-like esterase
LWIATSLVLCALFLSGSNSTADDSQVKRSPARFELRADDRVVLLGGGLIEQERRHGFLQTRLSRRVPPGSLVFRNLGWAGDTVRGIARTSGYQNPEGFARLLKEVQDYKPTVLIIGYGTNESFDGPAGLPGFREDYAKLLEKLAPLKARMVLLSPMHQEDLGRPFPDPTEHNRNLERYAAAIRQLADERKHAFVDLNAMGRDKSSNPRRRLTTNGVQLNETGSDLAARVIEDQLGLPRNDWSIRLNASGKVLASKGVQLDDVIAAKGGIRFQARDLMLAADGDDRFLQIDDLPLGDYWLQVDGERALRFSAADWKKGFFYSPPPSKLDSESLRRAIVANNELFYRRWRPFNDHSRHWGFIGGDGKLYDQEMAAQEKVIAERRRPPTHRYEIIRAGETK